MADQPGVSKPARADYVPAALAALRDRLAAEIDFCDNQATLTQLSREFRAVVADLSQVRPAAATKVDEVAEKYAQRLRAIRGEGAASAKRAPRKKQSG